jgi:predicted NACHT family NTPase
MTRSVRQINPSVGTTEAKPRQFSDFSGCVNLVLLGDPGAGKTFLFKQAAGEGGRYLKARRFLVEPLEALTDRTLFIDALDEKRGGRHDRDTVDALASRLLAAKPNKVRISCRAADWLGESDLNALSPYFDQSGTPVVLLLEKLTPEEQRAVLIDQAADSDAAGEFLQKAQDRGLAEFLENPQSLIMLWRAVQVGSWPATRRQLFEVSTDLMLRESDPERARAGSGIYSAEELRPAAGAICAARLISDIDAISLLDQEGTPETPSYRSITFINRDLLLASLGRRIFVVAAEQETVDYVHRTTAEYLAAAFLALRVRSGLPLARVVALIGVDKHPASELRGLHAWLAIHLPERSNELIEADPYGVLSYGDAASLSPSACTHLIRSLASLSTVNPWFRQGNLLSQAIGALARPEMVEEFRRVLRDPSAGQAVRSIVVDALWLGTPLPTLTPELQAVLQNTNFTFSERSHALLALIGFASEGKEAVVNAYRAGFDSTVNGIRLRADVLARLFGGPFDAGDVVALLNDTLTTAFQPITGTFWSLADSLPLDRLAEILDSFDVPERTHGGYDKRRAEVGVFYARILARVWRGIEVLDPGRTLRWLNKLREISEVHGETRMRELSSAMAATPERNHELAEHFFNTLVIEEQSWLRVAQFREATLFALSADSLLELAMNCFKQSEDNSSREKFFYAAAFNFAYQGTQPTARAIFETLCEAADAKPALRETRDSCISCALWDGYFEGKVQRAVDTETGRLRQRQEFQENAARIRSGDHLPWLTHAAKIYFGLYGDVDRTLDPRQRVSAWLGEDNLEPALQGFRAALDHKEVPSFATVVALLAERKYFEWWYALLAGINERWVVGEGLGALTDDVVKGLLAFDLTTPVYVSRGDSEQLLQLPWKQAILAERPDLACDAYIAVVRAKLRAREQYADGLQELLKEEAFRPYRTDIVLELLQEFPNAGPIQLAEILDTGVRIPALRAKLLEIAGDVVSKRLTVDTPQRDMWLATAYLLSPSAYQTEIERRAHETKGFIFTLRDRSGALWSAGEMAISELEFLASLTGKCWPSTPHPINGWSGDQNPWDATEYCVGLINLISATPTEAATGALTRLAANAQLASYRPHVLYALANQRQRRRDAEYDRPDWSHTVRALDDGPPATVADLHAFTVEHLRDLANRIARQNNDLYRQFWNVDGFGRPQSPRPEESCRDFLIELMRTVLLPLGVTVEPEGHMVADKRADISVAMPGRKVLCELKRDYHGDLWTAAKEQLERFYVFDPEAKGFGIYCVFWFGKDRPHDIPTPPAGLARPASAIELERMLSQVVGETTTSRITTVVLDVSGPPAAS